MSGGALRHVLWIGGGPGAGKTSVALRLARRYGLHWYGADTRTWQHRDRALAAGHPAARRFEAMTPRQRWEEATPEQMLAMSLHAERGRMVIDDLAALPESPLVVAEGTTLPAYALSTGVADRDRAVWLMPTRDFQDAALDARRMLPGQVMLYRLIGETVAGEAREHGARVVTVDGAWDVAATVDVVAGSGGDVRAGVPLRVRRPRLYG